ncbi:hypothetical protein K469DRAFT_211030 [Zopfia rhizophila CBS 207.26]|uniref:Uncharacterized protein n=1 Tax=Zopfia rhizophila CBS 207.26 TaxID=1314779 RepID=A0A6A6DUW6_9PEZI|nr:hypothetical protein K469DRAFT_211030 [Zopfia rhizophila CBS 207.26]
MHNSTPFFEVVCGLKPSSLRKSSLSSTRSTLARCGRNVDFASASASNTRSASPKLFSMFEIGSTRSISLRLSGNILKAGWTISSPIRTAVSPEKRSNFENCASECMGDISSDHGSWFKKN